MARNAAAGARRLAGMTTLDGAKASACDKQATIVAASRLREIMRLSVRDQVQDTLPQKSSRYVMLI